MSEDWNLSEEDRAFAASLGFEPHETAFQAAKFKDFWGAKAGRDGMKTDWVSTWRNWMRNAFERKATINGQKLALPMASGAQTFLCVRGEPEHDAWLAHYVRVGRHRDPHARFLDRLTVPSRWPPSDEAEGGRASAG